MTDPSRCAECGDPIFRDREYFTVEAAIQADYSETEKYQFHAECWYKVARGWDSDN